MRAIDTVKGKHNILDKIRNIRRWKKKKKSPDRSDVECRTHKVDSDGSW